jgi:hypothetical protein
MVKTRVKDKALRAIKMKRVKGKERNERCQKRMIQRKGWKAAGTPSKIDSRYSNLRMVRTRMKLRMVRTRMK